MPEPMTGPFLVLVFFAALFGDLFVLSATAENRIYCFGSFLGTWIAGVWRDPAPNP